jgi:hypothetical protein
VSLYHIVKGDGEEVGPVDKATVIRLRNSGVVNGQSYIRPADQEEWGILEQHADLMPPTYAKPRPAPVATPQAPAPAAVVITGVRIGLWDMTILLTTAFIAAVPAVIAASLLVGFVLWFFSWLGR